MFCDGQAHGPGMGQGSSKDFQGSFKEPLQGALRHPLRGFKGFQGPYKGSFEGAFRAPKGSFQGSFQGVWIQKPYRSYGDPNKRGGFWKLKVALA